MGLRYASGMETSGKQPALGDFLPNDDSALPDIMAERLGYA